jgi:hypothetical protein
MRHSRYTLGYARQNIAMMRSNGMIALSLTRTSP